jgi:hypothetical protein
MRYGQNKKGIELAATPTYHVIPKSTQLGSNQVLQIF